MQNYVNNHNINKNKNNYFTLHLLAGAYCWCLFWTWDGAAVFTPVCLLLAVSSSMVLFAFFFLTTLVYQFRSGFKEKDLKPL